MLPAAQTIHHKGCETCAEQAHNSFYYTKKERVRNPLLFVEYDPVLTRKGLACCLLEEHDDNSNSGTCLESISKSVP